jgi:hypothetical protein
MIFYTNQRAVKTGLRATGSTITQVVQEVRGVTQPKISGFVDLGLDFNGFTNPTNPC